MHFAPIENSSDDAYLAHADGGGGGDVEAGHQASVGQLDDVFGSVTASSAENEVQNGPHPSDMRRLETEHTTSGYREGITVAKESSIQAGFDEGFTLGAALGSQAGQLLGIVEGIADALKGHTTEAADASRKLLDAAKGDLSTDTIFSAEYWALDGNWSYEVTAQDGDQILFSDVANAHPMVQKWRRIVNEQLDKWHVQVSLLDKETGPRLDTAIAEPLDSSAPTRAKQPMDW